MTMVLELGVELYGAMRRLPVEIRVPRTSGKHSIPIDQRLSIGSLSQDFLYFKTEIEDEIVPVSNLAVTEFRELASDAGVHTLFGWVGEKLEITPGQFFEGCIGATALWHSDRRQFSNRRQGISYVGYVRRLDGLWALSGHVFQGIWHFKADAPDDVCLDWPAGTRVFSHARSRPVQEQPILSPIFRTRTGMRF